MNQDYPEFNVYKGLQKPLIFKGLKGKFIYWGAGCVIAGLLLCAAMSVLVSFVVGGITLIVVLFGGLSLVSMLQRKGLHNKDKRRGVYIVTKTFQRDSK